MSGSQSEDGGNFEERYKKMLEENAVLKESLLKASSTNALILSSPVAVNSLELSPDVEESPDFEESPNVDALSPSLIPIRLGFSPEETRNRRPKIVLDQYNRCAKAIIDHQHEKDFWKALNYIDDQEVNLLLDDDNHYLLYATRSVATFADQSPIECLKKFRSYLGLKAEVTPAQGMQLVGLLRRLFRKRGRTVANETVKLDPVRTDFKEYIGNVCLGKLVNPLCPRETGKSSQDYSKRIEIIAKKIRKLFFGEPEETTFYFIGFHAKKVAIPLPTLQDIQNEVKAKLYQKENQEDKYIRKYLTEYENYMEIGNLFRTPEEDKMHSNSTPIIDQYLRHKAARNQTFCSDAIKHKGGVGKARLFSNFAFVADGCTKLDLDYSLRNAQQEESCEPVDVEYNDMRDQFEALNAQQQRARGVKKFDSGVVALPAVSEVTVVQFEDPTSTNAYAQPKVLSRHDFAVAKDSVAKVGSIKATNKAVKFSVSYQNGETEDAKAKRSRGEEESQVDYI